MSTFKQIYPEKTPVEETVGLGVIRERSIGNNTVARVCRLADSEASYPFVVEVVRRYYSDDAVSYKFQDFKTEREAERFLARVI